MFPACPITEKRKNVKRNPMNPTKDFHGFTVIELLVTTGVALIVLGVAIPSFLTWLPSVRLSSAARQVASDLQVARMRAIAQNASNTVTFDATTGVYTFSLSNETRDIDQLYPGISISSNGNPAFTSRGTATSAVTITLSNGSQTKLVCVKTVGRVSIADGSCA